MLNPKLLFTFFFLVAFVVFGFGLAKSVEASVFASQNFDSCSWGSVPSGWAQNGQSYPAGNQWQCRNDWGGYSGSYAAYALNARSPGSWSYDSYVSVLGSPSFSGVAGYQYTLTFWYSAPSYGSPQLAVFYNTYQTTDGGILSRQIGSVITATSPTWQQFSATFTPGAGTWYVQFRHAFTSASSPILIDSVTLTESAACSGTVTLGLPSSATPSQQVTATVGGLSNCNGKTAYIRLTSCSGTQQCTCSVSGAGCSCNFNVSATPGTYTYYACVDKNGDSDYADAGESASASIVVSSPCSGTVTLSLPSSATPSQQVTATVGGLSSCDAKTAYIRLTSCSGTQQCTCSVSGAGCSCNFNVSATPGTYTYYACVDKNGDSDYADAGESASASVTVSAVPTVTTDTATIDTTTQLPNNQATLRGNITATGGQNADFRGFEWGTTSGSYPNSWTEGTSGTYQYGTGSFTYNLTGLSLGQTYYYRAKAHNSSGWGYGLEKRVVVYRADGGQRDFKTCQCSTYTAGGCCDGCYFCPVGKVSNGAPGQCVTPNSTYYCNSSEDCDDGDCSATKRWYGCIGTSTSCSTTDYQSENVYAQSGYTLTATCGITGTTLCGYSGYNGCAGVGSPYSCQKKRDQLRCAADNTCSYDVGDNLANVVAGYVCSGGTEVAASTTYYCGFSAYNNRSADKCDKKKDYLACNANVCNYGDYGDAYDFVSAYKIANTSGTEVDASSGDNAGTCHSCIEGSCSGFFRWGECNGAGGPVPCSYFQDETVYASAGKVLNSSCASQDVTTTNYCDFACDGSCRIGYRGCVGSGTACETTFRIWANCAADTSCSAGACSAGNYCATNQCRDGSGWHHRCSKRCDGANGCNNWADATCLDHCTNSVQDCDETGTDCGGSCTACVGLPSVTTNPASSVEGTTANLNGYLNSDGGAACSVWFEWGDTSSYGNSTTPQTGQTTGASFASSLSSLTKGKTYHFRANAQNASGTNNGSDATFITKPDAPTGLNANAVSSSQIDLSWTKGTGAYNTKVQRGPAGGACPSSPTDGTQVYYSTGASANDTGLTSGTTYCYRAWSEASEEGLTKYSDGYAQASATTPEYTPISAPEVTTKPAENVTYNSAVLKGELVSLGCTPPCSCDVWFKWGTNPASLGNSTPRQVMSAPGYFSYELTGLAQNTTYYFQAFAQNSASW